MHQVKCNLSLNECSPKLVFSWLSRLYIKVYILTLLLMPSCTRRSTTFHKEYSHILQVSMYILTVYTYTLSQCKDVPFYTKISVSKIFFHFTTSRVICALTWCRTTLQKCNFTFARCRISIYT